MFTLMSSKIGVKTIAVVVLSTCKLRQSLLCKWAMVLNMWCSLDLWLAFTFKYKFRKLFSEVVFRVAYVGTLPLTSTIVQYAVYKLTCQNPLLVLLFCCRYMITLCFFFCFRKRWWSSWKRSNAIWKTQGSSKGKKFV